MLSPGQLNRLQETRFPVRFRVLSDKVLHEAVIVSFSPERLIIVADRKLYVGKRLSLSIRFPALSDGCFCEADFTGHIICGDQLADGRYGCQIEIERNSFHISYQQSAPPSKTP
jgi:hypothetical protein